MRIHHAAIPARDFEASLTFRRDGLGLGLGLGTIMDKRFPGEWRALFNADSDTINSELLGATQDDYAKPAVPRPRQIVNSGVRMAVVEDPDGVRVELIDTDVMLDMSMAGVR
jgi:catechol 2,3-dioxygenase-like lactoylglutathione lyase family enzyme